MHKEKNITIGKIAIITIFTLGIVLVVVSALYASSFIAIFGLAIIFWGAILLYIAPVKHVPLTLLNSSVYDSSDIIEQVLAELSLTEKGVYLPPKNLKNVDSSLLFIPETPKTPIPNQEEISERLYNQQKTGILLTPPGFALSKLFEQALGKSFTKTDLTALQFNLSELLVELEIAENVEIQTQANIVTVQITNSIFHTVCQDTKPQTHTQVGCLLTSAIGCALAKTAGKPITIQNEIYSPETKTTTIEYEIEEE